MREITMPYCTAALQERTPEHVLSHSKIAALTIIPACTLFFESIELGLWLVLAILCVASAVVDMRHQRIPNALNYTAFFLGSALLTIGEAWPQLKTTDTLLSVSLADGLLGAVSAFLFLFGVWACGLIGGGDVKLATAIGLLVGFPNALGVILAAHVVAASAIIFRSVLLVLSSSDSTAHVQMFRGRIPMAGFYTSGVVIVLCLNLFAA